MNSQSNVITLRGQGDEHVPENWGPAYCRARALEWRERAVVLPEDHPERSVCLELAEGYDKMATASFAPDDIGGFTGNICCS